MWHPESLSFYSLYGGTTLVLTAAISWILCGVARAWALRRQIIDTPRGRKTHTGSVPLLGGLGIIASLVIILPIIAWVVAADRATFFKLIGFMVGLLILGYSGYRDDMRDVKWTSQFISVAFAAAVTFIAGTRIEGFTTIKGDLFLVPVFIGLLLTILWFWGLTFATKILDGVDGLVASITVASTLIITALTASERWWQPDIGLLALGIGGSFIGFLIWNWAPASLFLGQSGSLAAGFSLAWISTASGSKLMTALLVFMLPVLDLIWTITRRWVQSGELSSVVKPDRGHLHHLLQRKGWSAPQIAISYVVFGGLCGVLSLGLTPLGKIFLLLFAVFMGSAFIAWAHDRSK